MTWTDVIDQEHVKAVLQRLIALDRLPHAMLFHGPDGCGKRAVSLALAQTLQCPTAGTTPCGACPPCKKVEKLVHPDVHVHFPQPSDADPHEVADRIRRLAADPYATVDFARRPSLDDPSRSSNRQTIYSVDTVRGELLRPMVYRPVEGRYKIAIVTDADSMNAPAANAFLKMLEEPPPRTLFVLTTSRLEYLLPTIVSRCHRLRFDPLPVSAIEEALVRREGAEAERAAIVARMAAGSFGRALDLLSDELLVVSRDQVVAFMRAAYAMDVRNVTELAGQMSSLGREPLKAAMNLLLLWIRDLLLHKELGQAAPIVNVDQGDTIARFCARLPDADFDAMARAVEDAVGLLERNVRADFLLQNLAFVFHGAIRGKRVEPLYSPLTA